VTPAVPTRVVGLDRARARYGARVDRLLPALWRGDPLADEAHAELEADPLGWRRFEQGLAGGSMGGSAAVEALFASVASRPSWVDVARAGRAGRLLFRSGLCGGIVLGARSLATGYCAPAGNKPLVLTGRLTTPAAASQRLAETGAFLAAVCAPGGMEPGAPGFAVTLRVRVMHARVRALARRHPAWRAGDWGDPVNQHDLLATSLLFSQVFVDGVRAFGVGVTRAEADDWLHLWRWVSVVLGVEEALLPEDEPEARALADLIHDTQGPPDADARRLVDVMLSEAETRPGGGWLARGLCRAMLGDETADALGLPDTPAKHAVRVASRLLVGPVDRLRAVLPGWEARLEGMGRAYWAASVRASSRGRPLGYHPPERLGGRPGGG
jgi:hypothetical protein